MAPKRLRRYRNGTSTSAPRRWPTRSPALRALPPASRSRRPAWRRQRLHEADRRGCAGVSGAGPPASASETLCEAAAGQIVILLDTDHLSVLRYVEHPRYAALKESVESAARSDRVATTVISLEEHM